MNSKKAVKWTMERILEERVLLASDPAEYDPRNDCGTSVLAD